VANTSPDRAALRGVGLRFPWKPQNALAAPATPLALHGPAYRALRSRVQGRPLARTSTLPRRPFPALPRSQTVALGGFIVAGWRVLRWALAVANTSRGEALRGVGLRFPWKPQNALAAPATPLPLHGPAYRALRSRVQGRPLARTSILSRRPFTFFHTEIAEIPQGRASSVRDRRRIGALARPPSLSPRL
jgi:hypothetical protein